MEDKKKILIVGEPGSGVAARLAHMIAEGKIKEYPQVITVEDFDKLVYVDLPTFDRSAPSYREIDIPIIETHKIFTPPPTRAERRKKERNEKKKIISDNKRKKK